MTAALGLAAFAGLIAADELVVRALFGTDYLSWYLANGATLSLVVAFVTLAWGDLNEIPTLISAHPQRKPVPPQNPHASRSSALQQRPSGSGSHGPQLPFASPSSNVSQSIASASIWLSASQARQRVRVSTHANRSGANSQ